MSKGNTKYYADILSTGKGDSKESYTKLVKRGKLVKERFKTRDKSLDEVERYYDSVGVTKREDGEVYEINVPDGQSATDLIADLISGQEINIRVPALSETQKAKSFANDVENWLKSWLVMSQRDEDMMIIHEMAHDIVIRGASVFRVLMLDERMPKKGDDKNKNDKGKFPLLPEIRDWRYCYPVYQRTRLVEIFECYEATAGDIAIDWPEYNLPQEWESDDTVNVWEWWSEDKKAFWVSGKTYSDVAGNDADEFWLMKPTTHGYGTLPYSVRLMRPQTKRRNDPAKMAPSLLETWSGTLDAINLIESAKFTSAMSYVNSAWMVYTNRRGFELDLTHGAVNYLYPDQNEKVEPLTKSELPLDLMNVSEEWSSRFQRASVPGALFGEGVGPNMAGYAISLLTESGRRILIPVVRAIEYCISDACGVALSISENLLGPTLKNHDKDIEVYVVQEGADKKQLIRTGVKLDWEAIKGMHMVECSLGDPMPQDEERAMNMAIAARQPNAAGLPLLSDETIRLDILEQDDNLKETTRIIAERLLVNLTETLAEEQAIEAGLIPSEEEVAMQQQAQQAPMQPPMPDPAMMGMGMPGMGTPAPDPAVMQEMQMLGSKVMELENVIVGLIEMQGQGQPMPAQVPPAMPPQPGMMPNEEAIPEVVPPFP